MLFETSPVCLLQGMLAGSPSHPSSEPSPPPVNMLQQYLSTHFHVPGEKTTRLQYHVVSDEYVEADWKDENLPSAFVTAREYLQKKHLILLSQILTESTGDGKKGQEGSVLVVGLCVVEYAVKGTGQPSRCYIQYVDTTGLVRPRSLQGPIIRSLLKTYICYARDVLQVSCLHLFASPKPSLLFAGSEVHGKKVVLGGRHLISWWFALLTETLTKLPEERPAIIFAYSPSEENLPASTRLTQHCIEKLQSRYRRPSLDFQYGVPYRGDESAVEAIPSFPDDPKWRHFEALLEAPSETRASRKRQKRESSALTVREFFSTLSVRSDFSKDHSALICVCFQRPQDFSTSPAVASRRADAATSILNILKMSTFESEQVAIRSSACILGMLKLIGVPSCPVHGVPELENVDPEDCCRFKEILTLIQPANDPTNARQDLPDVSVSDLQGFIKRKLPRGNV